MAAHSAERGRCWKNIVQGVRKPAHVVKAEYSKKQRECGGDEKTG